MHTVHTEVHRSCIQTPLNQVDFPMSPTTNIENQKLATAGQKLCYASGTPGTTSHALAMHTSCSSNNARLMLARKTCCGAGEAVRGQCQSYPSYPVPAFPHRGCCPVSSVVDGVILARAMSLMGRRGDDAASIVLTNSNKGYESV